MHSRLWCRVGPNAADLCWLIQARTGGGPGAAAPNGDEFAAGAPNGDRLGAKPKAAGVGDPQLVAPAPPPTSKNTWS